MQQEFVSKSTFSLEYDNDIDEAATKAIAGANEALKAAGLRLRFGPKFDDDVNDDGHQDYMLVLERLT